MKAIQENMRRGLFLCIVVFLLAMVLLIPYEEDVTASDGIVYPSITCNGYVEKTTDPFSPGFYIYYGSVPDDHCLVGNDDDDFNEFWRGFTEWDISMIPIDADIVYVGYQMYCDGKPEDCQKFGIYMDIYQMENRPSTMEPGTETWESIYNDTHEGTCYVSDWAITLRTGYWPSESAFYNLGPAAAQDLEDQLSSGWFALGFSMYETTPSDEGIKFTDGVLKVVYGDIPINNPPTANDDSYSTIGDATLDIWAPGVLANDISPVKSEYTQDAWEGDPEAWAYGDCIVENRSIIYCRPFDSTLATTISWKFTDANNRDHDLTVTAEAWYKDLTNDNLYIISTSSTLNMYINSPPNTPSKPSGPYWYIEADWYYDYSTSTTDPDGDDVKYQFDWGDGWTTTTGSPENP